IRYYWVALQRRLHAKLDDTLFQVSSAGGGRASSTGKAASPRKNKGISTKQPKIVVRGDQPPITNQTATAQARHPPCSLFRLFSTVDYYPRTNHLNSSTSKSNLLAGGKPLDDLHTPGGRKTKSACLCTRELPPSIRSVLIACGLLCLLAINCHNLFEMITWGPFTYQQTVTAAD
ncbi:hypothetical protein PspLS_08958, partial [Pyricularia sp. CBS 133598]